jgi:hypothetical protein
MSSRRAGVGISVAVFFTMVAFVVGGLAIVSFMNRTPVPPPTPLGNGGPAEFISTVSPQGLQLQIMLNATEVPQGGAVRAHVLLLNTLPRNVSLHPDFAANPNIDSWNWLDYLCGLSPVEHTFGFALFEGHYTAANVTLAGAPLTLFPPVALSCLNSYYGESYIKNVDFAPLGDVATFSANSSFSTYFEPQTVRMQLNATTGGCTLSPYGYTETVTIGGGTTTSIGTAYSLSCGSNGIDSVWGYWEPLASCHSTPGFLFNGTNAQGLQAFYNQCFHRFAAGTYTIVAEDLWNQTLFAYFDVQPPVSTSTTTVTQQYPITFLATPTGCSIQGFCINATLVNHLGHNQTIILSALFQNATTGRNVAIKGSNDSMYYATCMVDWQKPSSCDLIAYPEAYGTYRVTLVVLALDGRTTLSPEEVVTLGYGNQ